MGLTLLTGGTGFLGARVARLLHERGDQLRLALRPGTPHEELDFPFEEARCDILDRNAVRRAMRGVERVIHLAGLTSLRASSEAHFRVNAQGTRIVLEEALRAEVQRVVHTSSVAAIGPAPYGTSGDEEQLFRGGALGIPYVNSKREAEVEALRLAGRGLPVVIVCPALVFGGGDRRHTSTAIVRRFMRQEIPAYVDGAVNIVDVGDVARGLLLAEERGTVGERYILGNRNFTYDRLFADLGRISGIEPPSVKLPLSVALAVSATLERLPGPSLAGATELRAMGQWWAFRSTKAKRELGYEPSPHEDTLEATVAWYREHESRSLAPAGSRQPWPLRATGLLTRELGGFLGAVGAPRRP